MMRPVAQSPKSPTLRAASVAAGALGAAGWFASRLTEPVVPPPEPAALQTEMSAIRTEPSRPAVWGAAEHEPMVRNPFVSSVLVARQKQIPQPSPPVVSEQPTRERIQAEATSTLVLRAILLGPVRIAMINGRAHQEGDAISTFRLLRIEEKQVVVEKDGEQVTLGIRGP